MTRTTQLRASKVAETKSSELRKTCSTLTTRPPTGSISKVPQNVKLINKPSTNIPKQQSNEQPEIEPYRRKSFNGPSLSTLNAKKQTIQTNPRTNENQLNSTKTATNTIMDYSKNILKKTNLNKLNK